MLTLQIWTETCDAGPRQWSSVLAVLSPWVGCQGPECNDQQHCQNIRKQSPVIHWSQHGHHLLPHPGQLQTKVTANENSVFWILTNQKQTKLTNQKQTKLTNQKTVLLDINQWHCSIVTNIDLAILMAPVVEPHHMSNFIWYIAPLQKLAKVTANERATF